MTRTFLILIAALTLSLTSANAEHCSSYSTSTPEVDMTHSGSPYYIDNDPCQPECHSSTWIYEESNGISGLQRGDEVVDDTCHGMIDGDTIVF